jgi:hypothetical protein
VFCGGRQKKFKNYREVQKELDDANHVGRLNDDIEHL